MADTDQITLDNVEHLSSLQVTMFKRVYDLNPAEDLAMSVSSIGEHLQGQPSKYAFYASLRDLATSKTEQLQSRYHRIRAELDGQIRRQGELPDGGKITEDSLRRCLAAHPDVVEAEKTVHRASSEVAIFNSIVRAFEQRRDCLIALANRQNSGVFHDKDAKVTVHAGITPVSELKERTAGAGAHPSRAKKS
jgi:hypothetical protein